MNINDRHIRHEQEHAANAAGNKAENSSTLKDNISFVSSAEQAINLLGGTKDLKTRWKRVEEKFPVRIPLHYLELIKKEGLTGPLAKMALPQSAELNEDKSLLRDPLGEDDHEPVKGLIHRYEDRALCLVTTKCAIYCRFCTRKRLTGKGYTNLTQQELRDITEYLRNHSEIREVIISGGDPLVMPLDKLDCCLKAIRAVKSVKIVRLGTRVPAAIPGLITQDTAQVLANHGPLFVLTHFNHPGELSPEAKAALGRLADAGLPLLNQTVLLSGINDDAETLGILFQELLTCRVKPYYLHQCDLTIGTGTFRTDPRKGMEIMRNLRTHLSGLAMPTFIVDLPGGRGKVPLTHNYLRTRTQEEQTDRVHGSGSSILIEDATGNPVEYPVLKGPKT